MEESIIFDFLGSFNRTILFKLFFQLGFRYIWRNVPHIEHLDLQSENSGEKFQMYSLKRDFTTSDFREFT